jgi:hypothetical protein
LFSMQVYRKFEGSLKANYYDIDWDLRCDIKEIYASPDGDSFKKHPIDYFIDTNQDGDFSEYIDPSEDGLNGNEIYIQSEEEYNPNIINL